MIAPPQLFPSEGDKPLVVIMPGMGMAGRYYRPIAEALAEAGFPAAIGELRGQGESPCRASRKVQWGYHHQAAEDFPQTIIAAKQGLFLDDDHPTLLLTHSMGGQIGVLFMARPEARELNVIGMYGVGAGNPWYKAFPGMSRVKWGLGIQTMALVARVLGYWPGDKVKMGANYGRHPKTMTNEWSRMNRTGKRGVLAGQDIDYVAAMREVDLPVVLARFKNDEDCTLASAQALADQVAGAEVRELDGDLGHNRWAREPATVVKEMLEFSERAAQ